MVEYYGELKVFKRWAKLKEYAINLGGAVWLGAG
jgi:hypothetical protein